MLEDKDPRSRVLVLRLSWGTHSKSFIYNRLRSHRSRSFHLAPKPETPFEYKHEAQASESVFPECTHSLALRACIKNIFTYVVSIPKERKRATSKRAIEGLYLPE